MTTVHDHRRRAGTLVNTRWSARCSAPATCANEARPWSAAAAGESRLKCFSARPPKYAPAASRLP